MTIDALFIDRLRDAAKEHGAVFDLLTAIGDGLLIDDLGNKEIVALDADLDLLKSAQIAFEFAKLDRKEEA